MAAEPRAIQSTTRPGGSRAYLGWEAACLVVLFLIFLVTASAAYSLVAPSSRRTRTHAAPPKLQGSPAAAGPVVESPESPSAATQVQIDKAVADTAARLREQNRDDSENSRMLLDKLVTLVGGFSLLVGLTAFFSLKSAREEAQSQIALSGKQLDDHFTSTKDRLKLLEDQQKSDWEAFRTKIWSELPDMRNLQEGLRDLLFDLEQVIPQENDWNDERSYESLNDAQRQKILLSETTIAALPTLISREAPGNVTALARLYRALARFYFGRFKAERVRADAARADVYLTSALRIEPDHAGSYRLRGAIFLAQHRFLTGSTITAATEQAKALLESAERNLRHALEKDKNELGAYYNLALAVTLDDRLDEGIALVEGVLKRLKDFSVGQQRKYVASLVLNQACDLNSKARATPAQQAAFRARAVATLLHGINFLKAAPNELGLAALQEAFQKEILASGDLSDLTVVQKDEVLHAFAKQDSNCDTLPL